MYLPDLLDNSSLTHFSSSACRTGVWDGYIQCVANIKSIVSFSLEGFSEGARVPKIQNSIVCKVEKILKGSLDSILSPSPLWNYVWKSLLEVEKENIAGLFFSRVCWHHPAMFCLITSSKLSHQTFEFSLKLKVMESNPGYLLKSFLL